MAPKNYLLTRMVKCLPEHGHNPLLLITAIRIVIHRRHSPLPLNRLSQLRCLFSTIRPVEMELHISLGGAQLAASIRAIDVSRLTRLRLEGESLTPWRVSEAVLQSVGHIIVAAAQSLRELDLDCHGQIAGPTDRAASFPHLSALSVPGRCIAAGHVMEGLLTRCQHLASLTIYGCSASYSAICNGKAARANTIRSKLCADNAGALKALTLRTSELSQPELTALAAIATPCLTKIGLSGYRKGVLALLPATTKCIELLEGPSASDLGQLAAEFAKEQTRIRLPQLVTLQVPTYTRSDTFDGLSADEHRQMLQSVCKKIGVDVSWPQIKNAARQ